jgi:hypothetical protein
VYVSSRRGRGSEEYARRLSLPRSLSFIECGAGEGEAPPTRLPVKQNNRGKRVPPISDKRTHLTDPWSHFSTSSVDFPAGDNPRPLPL